ncbi:MAG: PEP-CTERM sorting domain-containing protein, partial [Planctomycetota bacterium]
DISDLDLLVRQVVRGSTHSAFDINGDGTVDVMDVTDPENGWLAQAGEFFANLPVTGGNPYLVGDANLDGVVDVSDFNVFNENKFTETGLWSLGDFNADNFTDVADFNAWNGNKFTSSSTPAAVPEPGSGMLMLITVVMLGLGVRTTKLANRD